MDKLQPKLRFSKFEEKWEFKKIGEIYNNLRTGMTPYRGKPEYYNGDILWIASGELNYGYINDTREKITQNAVNDTNLEIYPPNTLFIAITGLEAPGTRGKCALNSYPATTNQSCMAFDENENLSTKFLFYWYQKHGEALYYEFAQGTKQQSFNNTIVKRFLIGFPNKKEQTKIANFLSSIDEKINLLKEKKSLLEDYKKGIMQKIFNQEIRFKDDNGKDFEDWEEKSLGELCDYKNGGSFEKFVCDDGIYNLISLNSIDITGKIKNSHKKVSVTDNSLQKGDLIMVLSDVAHGNFLGLTDIVPDDNFVLNQRMGALKPVLDFNSFYLKTFINFNQSYFKLMGQGSSQQNLSKGDIESFIIKLPSKEEQTKIANFLSAIDKKIELVSNQIQDTQEYKKGLLQQMFV